MTAPLRYLKSYNLILSLGWGIFLLYFILNSFQLDPITLILLNVCQLSAILEIYHAYRKWVKAGVFFTFIQVLSRVVVLLLIDFFPNAGSVQILSISGISLIAIAWGLTETIRYAYYYQNLKNSDSGLLQYLRYTLFIILYPLGVLGELLIIYSVLDIQSFDLTGNIMIMFMITLLYAVFFPQLYLYMFKQRRKKLTASEH